MRTYPKHLALIAALSLPNTASAQARTVEVNAASGFAAPFQVNGQPVRLRIDPEGASVAFVNPAVAARLGLRPTLLEGEMIIGPVKVPIETKVANVRFGTERFERRFGWGTRNVAQDVDGVISPAHFPFDRVVFHLRAPRGGEVPTTLPLAYNGEYGLFYAGSIAGQRLIFQFSLSTPRTMATAGAGSVLAAAYNGSWAGPVSRQPIAFGVARPVRPMRLAQPMRLGGLSFSQLLVRTLDHPGGALPSDVSTDPNEAIVTGKRGGQQSSLAVTIGLDQLAECSRLVYERVPRRLILYCRPS